MRAKLAAALASRGPVEGVLLSVGVVAAATGSVFALRPVAPVLSLGVLYVFAVLPVAVLFGLAYALPVSIASILAFDWFFLPPRHTFELRDSENWVALAVYLATSVVVSELAAGARRRAAEAEQRERESALLADVSAGLLEAAHVQSELRRIAAGVARVLGAPRGSIEVESRRRPDGGEKAYDLAVGDRHVGRLFLEAGAEPAVADRVLPAVASVLAVAIDRERFAARALETEALRRSDRMKTAILRAVSHDLRSPLTAIVAAAEGLESRSLVLTEDDRAALLATIRSEAERLDRLVANLLDLSRLEAGAAKPRPELWAVDALVARALEDLGEGARRVDVSLPAETLAVRVDGAQIERVLVNLLDNALKHSSPSDSVELGVEGDAGDAIVRVVDRGPGLSDQDLERIFEPFERAGREPVGRGSGLGLAIARGFAAVNGGRLWAQSPPGGGAEFVLALPQAQVPARVRS
jgi:two-component system sensor histidine kinase KdpD